MTDYFQRVTDEQDFFKKIASKIPGFGGYIERNNRRAADKLLRETVANHYETLWQKVSEMQREFISNGDIDIIDDLEQASIKIRQFIDRIKNAAYGYAGFFDAVKVKQEELAAIYEFDLQFLKLEDELNRGIENIDSSIGTEGLPAAIRNVVSISQNCIDVFEKRKEVILSMVEDKGNGEK
jgi:hypothetical protein